MFEPNLMDFILALFGESAKRSLHLNVGYLWWCGPISECFKCKKVTMPEY